MYCEVAPPQAPLDALTYTFDPTQVSTLEPGDLLLVPLCKKPVLGVVLRITEVPLCPDKDIQPVLKVLKKQVVSPELLSLVRWVADYYLCPVGEVLGLVVPNITPSFFSEEHCSSGIGKSVKQEFSVTVATRVDDFRARVQKFIAEALGCGSVLFLMPEPYFAEWLPFLQNSFVNAVVEYHHHLTQRQLRANWFSLLAADHKVVVGVRRAVWAPVKNLAGIVIISEHSQAFKEERQPKYHARDVAIIRARFASCPVLILDPTPTLETWWNVRHRRFKIVDRLRLPRFRENVFVVDMRRHQKEVVSPRLLRELNLALERKKSALLYINRLGLARFVVCEDCGQVLKCPNCLVPVLVTGTAVVCKLCGYTSGAPDFCPRCQGTQFLFRAPGVEMVVRSLEKLGIKARIFSKDDNHAQVLVGTRRMLSCEAERDLGLIALVNFDTELALPDFRSRERAFTLLVELLQRAERAQARMVIQTYRPFDPVINLALAGDLRGFIKEELRMRQEAGFPPYRRLVALTVKGKDEKKARSEALALMRDLEKIPGAEVFNPMPLRIILKLPREVMPGRVISRSLLKRKGVKIKVDVDPLKVI